MKQVIMKTLKHRQDKSRYNSHCHHKIAYWFLFSTYWYFFQTLSKKYMRCSIRTMVKHLQRYLTSKLKVPPEQKVNNELFLLHPYFLIAHNNYILLFALHFRTALCFLASSNTPFPFMTTPLTYAALFHHTKPHYTTLPHHHTTPHYHTTPQPTTTQHTILPYPTTLPHHTTLLHQHTTTPH